MYIYVSYTDLYLCVLYLCVYIQMPIPTYMQVHAANKLVHLFKCLDAYSKLRHYAVY